MPRRIEPVFRETVVGLKRNGSIAVAAISTAFISVFLVGGALLINRQANLLIDALTGNVEVSVFLSDPVNTDNVTHLTSLLTTLPSVADVHYEDKAEACARFQKQFAQEPALVENTPCSALPASLRVKMRDPNQFRQVAAALGCTQDASGNLSCGQPGVERVRDNRTTLNAMFSVIRFFRIVVGVLAVIALIASALLIANTIRVGLFARRREIGIMRLVGATNWRIRVPFLAEGVIQGLLGAGIAILFLFIVKVTLVDPERTIVKFVPFIRNGDIVAIVPWLIVLSVLVSLGASLFAMRRFLEV